MQRVLGYGAAASGLALLPAAVMIGTISLGFSARLGTRFGARAVLLAGLNLIVAALTLLARAPVHPFTAATSCTSGGYHLAFAVGAGLTAAAAILVAIVLRPNAAVSPPAQDEPAAQPVSSARA
jgi:hypothetical protein